MASAVTSIYNNVISAASAGFAPTNSADVSAIASAYQVVSAIGTGWNSDDDEIVSSVNGCILSADEARRAGAADSSNYARYDRRPTVAGGYRTISSLPGSAEVSAIASRYAESAASSKQDALTFGYNTASAISSIDGSALAGGGGIDSATCSAIASAYAESAVSSKADSSALSSYVPYSSLEYNTASAISGINGSALAAGSTYSAGEGIDITDDVISVETPVDIVAGPGIVIDNPDGNTLRVSVAQAEEVVLYDAGDSPSQTGPWQISESRTNFEWIDIVFGNDSAGSMKQVTRFAANSNYMKLHLPRYDEEPSYKWSTMTLSWAQLTASIKTNSVGRFTIASNGAVSVSTAAAQAPYLFQIIGVHRINGGN